MAYDGGVGRVYTTAASPWFIEEFGFEFRERGVLPDDVSRLAGIIDALTRATKRLEARADALSLTDDEPALAHAHREATSGRGAIQHAPDDERPLVGPPRLRVAAVRVLSDPQADQRVRDPRRVGPEHALVHRYRRREAGLDPFDLTPQKPKKVEMIEGLRSPA